MKRSRLAAERVHELLDYDPDTGVFTWLEKRGRVKPGDVAGTLTAVPELGTTVLIIPGSSVKNGDDRLVVVNRVARSVIEGRRGIDPAYAFTYKGRPISRMLTSSWLRARDRAGLAKVRVHHLKHTFDRRLRAAGVSFEDRQDLLGHRSGRITTLLGGRAVAAHRGRQSRVCRWRWTT